jgi:hypothetical protein
MVPVHLREVGQRPAVIQMEMRHNHAVDRLWDNIKNNIRQIFNNSCMVER